jgi:hypothetical protein
VNLTQTVTNTLPLLKPKYTMLAMVKVEEAIRSYIMGKPNHDWRILERADVVSLHRYTEAQGAYLLEHGNLARFSLLFFDKAEQFNRAVALMGAYHRAKDNGQDHGPAFREAERVMLLSQHNYGNSNKPELLRNVFIRVPAQFKNFLAQQLAFTWELGRRGITGRNTTDVPIDRDAILYHLVSLWLVAGAVGLPFVSLLAALIKMLFDYDPLEELKKKALELQARGALSAAAWVAIVRGMPAVVLGEDMSARAGMGEQFFPTAIRDAKGPWINTIQGAIQLGEMQAGFVDQLANLSPGLGKPFKSIEAAANGLPMQDVILRPKAFYEAMADNKIDWRNPWKYGYTEYDETLITHGDLARMAFGSTPVKVGELRDLTRAIESAKNKDRLKTKLYINKVVSAAKRYADDPKELDRVLDNIAKQMEKDEFVVSPNAVKEANQAANRPRILRALKSTPRKLRPEILQLLEPLLKDEEGAK